MVGDPVDSDCAGNTVQTGSVSLLTNYAGVRLTVRGNTIQGDLTVTATKGSSDKAVEGNAGGQTLSCSGNSLPFSATGNTGWQQRKGQCARP